MKVLDIDEQFSWLTLQRLEQESALDSDFEPPKPFRWIAFGTKSNGACVIQCNYIRSLPSVQLVDKTVDMDPTVEQFQFGMNLAHALNKEIAHDGSWLVAWTHPPHFSEVLRIDPSMEWRRLVMIFLDKDGDPQFTVDSIRPWPQLVSSGINHFVDQCQQGIEKWQQHIGFLNLKEGQTIKLAKSGR